jgi:hypothetical protein
MKSSDGFIKAIIPGCGEVEAIYRYEKDVGKEQGCRRKEDIRFTHDEIVTGVDGWYETQRTD